MRDNPNIENSIFRSIHAVSLDTMPGYKSEGVEHSFLERFDRVEEELKTKKASPEGKLSAKRTDEAELLRQPFTGQLRQLALIRSRCARPPSPTGEVFLLSSPLPPVFPRRRALYFLK